MRHFADTDAPLYTLLWKEVTWHWTDTEEYAMCSLFTTLCSHTVLALPDFTKPFPIECNTSDTAVGVVLTQKHASIYKLLAFLRKTLTSSK